MQINLDMKTVLPKVRAAYSEGILQMQQESEVNGKTRCRYDGPCAIGIAMTPEEQNFCDSSTWSGIPSLIRNDTVVVPPDEIDDFGDLQRAHDDVARYNYGYYIQSGMHQEKIEKFELYLAELEEKYGVA